METTGINAGYLLIQLLCLGSFILVAGGAAVLQARHMGRILRRAEDEAQGELLLTVTAGPDGVLVPAELLGGSRQVEIRQQRGRLLLIPLPDSAEI